MKRFFALILALILVLPCVLSCTKEKEEEAPTKEELIQKRIEEFVTAYNDGDMETVLSCLDAKTRNAFQAMLNLLGGLAGKYTGIDVDLSDLFSLGISTASGDFMNLIIKEIKVIDSKNAIATTTMKLSAAETSTIYFVMVYEHEGWFIHDMTDKKPTELNSSKEDGTGNECEDGSQNENTPQIESYLLSDCSPFVDERAWVSYYKKDTYHSAFIDTQGNILYSVESQGHWLYNIGKGSAIIRTSSGMTLIDKNGNVTLQLDGNFEVKACGDGYAWIYQNKSTITTLEHLYGVLNANGTWTKPLENLQEKELYDNLEYMGSGCVGKNTKNGYYIWNADQSMTIIIERFNPYWGDNSFFDGGIFLKSTNYRYSIGVTITKNGKTVEDTPYIDNDCILYLDGRLIELDFEMEFFSDGKFVTKKGDYYRIIDFTKEKPVAVDFTAYPASMIENMTFHGKYGLVQIHGVDEKTYVTMIDTSGTELITPIKGIRIQGTSLSPDGYIWYKQNGIYQIMDKNGTSSETTLPGSWDVSVTFESNIGIVHYLSTSDYVFSNGEKPFEYLKSTK
ncbi:MAG: hypothetical protein IKJ35_00845 [Clostridia bacterium]|nr:hypothetical protein [Clostridia bacterium]